MRLLSFFVMGHSEEPKALSTIRGALGFPGVWQLQSTLCWGGQSCGAGTLPCLTALLHPAAKGLPAQALLTGLWTNRNKKQGHFGVGCPHSSLPGKLKALVHAYAGGLELAALHSIKACSYRAGPKPCHSSASDLHRNTAPSTTLFPGGQNCSSTLMSIWPEAEVIWRENIKELLIVFFVVEAVLRFS